MRPSDVARRELGEPAVIQPFWTDLIVAAGVLASLAFTVGYELRGKRESEKPAPEPTIVYRTPLTQWQCTKQEFREHQFACAQRERSANTKPTQGG